MFLFVPLYLFFTTVQLPIIKLRLTNEKETKNCLTKITKKYKFNSIEKTQNTFYKSCEPLE